jgi:hypothetical protein
MHRLYLEKYEPELVEGQRPRVEEWIYRKSFNEEFNYGFGYPRSDTCEQCDLLKIGINSAQEDNQRVKLQTELATHQEKSSQGYQALRTDSRKSSGTSNTLVLTFDLQQTYLYQHLPMVQCFI